MLWLDTTKGQVSVERQLRHSPSVPTLAIISQTAHQLISVM